MKNVFRSYTHVERLEENNEEVAGLLQSNPVYITAKVDGTNAVVWFDGEKVCGGSRTRQLSLKKDNADFYNWLLSGNAEAEALRKVVIENPYWIIYGEWLGFNKFIGQIKSYNSTAKGHMYIFDVYDINVGHYLPDPTWREALKSYGLEPYYVELLAILDNPSYEEVVEIAKQNKFLLDYAENIGEGVVCKAPNYRNKYGRNAYGKIVLEEFKERKKQGKRKANPQAENIEEEIVNYWITESEMAKAKEKVCVALDIDSFDSKNGKCIGFFLEMIWKDLLTEMSSICKQHKNPIIDFKILRQQSNMKGRKFLGLIK